MILKLIGSIIFSATLFQQAHAEVTQNNNSVQTATPQSINPASQKVHASKSKNFDYTHTFYREKKTKEKDGKETIQLEYVEQTLPGEELVAIATFKYKEKKPASQVVFTLPLPKETIYVEGSATNEKFVWFSVDNAKSWSHYKNLRVIEADGTKRIATSKDITHLQWRMNNDMQPGHEGKIEYRVIIR